MTGGPGAREQGGDQDEAREDAAAEALDALVAQLEHCLRELERARVRAVDLRRQRRAGRSWQEMVGDEQRPLVVESISTVLSALSGAGSRFRREEALALQAEGMSINRIAAAFGVTRQRISALVRPADERPDDTAR